MNRRNFLLGSLSLALAGYLGIPGTALANTKTTDAERILRITRRSMQRMRFIEPPEMAEIVNNPQNRYLIISLQELDKYTQGHVPGAVWMPYRDLLDPARAEKLLAKIPQSRSIILTCANGHLSCAVALYLRQLGYNVFAHAFGMDRWNRQYAGEEAYPGSLHAPVTPNVTRLQLDASAQFPRKYANYDDKGLIKQVAYSRLHNKFEIHIKPADFKREMKNQLILCLMRPEDYAKYHIPGAINIPGEAFYAGDELLLWLPRDKKITLSCYVGHFSSAATTLLRQLGYNAQTLDWGMAGWNTVGIPEIAGILEEEKTNPVESGAGQNIYRL